ncbi:PRC-barrel domain containing protein [Roseovarius sp. S4756]|uniref:PRC-barrel domain containing protein n=1 Tax=Roseovarius maritimus TaxID=3342637 RepID=UPI003726291C
MPPFAQDQMHEVNDNAAMSGVEINADRGDDLDVLDTAGRKIGEVEEVAGPDRDTPEALVVDFEDEITDYGDEDRVLPLSVFTFDGNATLLADGTDIKRAPIWRD